MVGQILLALVIGLAVFSFSLGMTGMFLDLWDMLPWSRYQKTKRARAKRIEREIWEQTFLRHKIPDAPRPVMIYPEEEDVEW